MDRTQVIAALAILLFGAFLLGFLTHWVVTRLSRVSHRDLDELDKMAEELHEAEIQRDEAVTERHRVEHEAHRKLVQTEAELRAAMDGLRDARAEAADLRAFISEQNLRQP
ncbi:MAG: hypothetical protein NXH97_11425 [Rhodobacteraceae bacterium]|nr:hypothetical protein [Paracoccaceae bacterium]